MEKKSTKKKKKKKQINTIFRRLQNIMVKYLFEIFINFKGFSRISEIAEKKKQKPL